MAKPRLRVWIDGCCEPINPGGTAGYGVVAKNDEEILFTLSEIVGSGRSMSNNVAEYSGLISFLEWYLENRAWIVNLKLKERPVVYSDSSLLIHQMNGEWRVKQGLYVPYYEKAQELMRKNSIELSFSWIHREENEEADELSKLLLIKAGIEFRIQPVRS